MPRSHPARSEFDTMFIEPFSSEHEANTVLLRTHTSPVQIRVMQSWEPPIYAIMPGRVFRRDTPDATHMPVFHQIEGLVIDRDITFAHLAGIIESFTKAFFGSEFTSRLRPSFFPFTEPSAEFDIKRPNGDWIELDVAERRLHLDVSDEELARRRAALVLVQSPYTRGWEKLYTDHVLQADQGVDMDFLVGGSGDYVPRESH
jgi:hypothetical protein